MEYSKDLHHKKDKPEKPCLDKGKKKPEKPYHIPMTFEKAIKHIANVPYKSTKNKRKK